MDKDLYLNQALEQIKQKDIKVPFTLVAGSVVTDLELYLKSLGQAYLSTTDARINKLLQDKIEYLKNI